MRMPERVTTRGVGSPPPKAQGFLGKVNPPRVSRDLRMPPTGGFDGQGANIPPPGGKDDSERTPRQGTAGCWKPPRRKADGWTGSEPPSGHEKPSEDNPSARTAIRHRCAWRVSSGVRENPREGTRQNDPVPSVQGVLPATGAAENRLWRLFIKNTGLC